MLSPMMAPAEPTAITAHSGSLCWLASTPPSRMISSPGKNSPTKIDASAAGSAKIRTRASQGGKPSSLSARWLTAAPSADREAQRAGDPDDQAVDGERHQGPGLEVADEEPDREVGGGRRRRACRPVPARECA